MPRKMTLVALAIACTGLGLAGAATSPAAAKPDEQAFTLISAGPISGQPGRRASLRTRIAFPASWDVVRRTQGSVSLRAAGPGCTYTVVVRSRVVAGDQPNPGARAEHVLPAERPYLLRSRTWPRFAWRIVRVRDKRRTRVEAVRDATFDGGTGKRLWIETRISAASRPMPLDECHAGSYRQRLASPLAHALDGLTAVARKAA